MLGLLGSPVQCSAAVFLFLYFIFLFFIKIYFCFRNLQKYTRLSSCGAAEVFLQKFREIFYRKAPGGPVARQRGGRPHRPPSSGARAPAARQQGDRLPHPYIRVGGSSHPSFASLKFQKPRKEREGGREAKPCRIFEPATAGNQNFSMLYK